MKRIAVALATIPVALTITAAPASAGTTWNAVSPVEQVQLAAPCSQSSFWVRVRTLLGSRECW